MYVAKQISLLFIAGAQTPDQAGSFNEFPE
jgi:hypothetical protein